MAVARMARVAHPILMRPIPLSLSAWVAQPGQRAPDVNRGVGMLQAPVEVSAMPEGFSLALRPGPCEGGKGQAISIPRPRFSVLVSVIPTRPVLFGFLAVLAF